MFPPIRWQGSVFLILGLLIKGLFQHLEQFLHWLIVAVLRLQDDLLGQVVAQNVLRVYPAHGVFPFIVATAFLL